MHAVAERLREAGLEVRELPNEMLVRNPREPERGLVSVGMDDPEDLFVSWEHSERESYGIEYPETDQETATIATEILELIGGDPANPPPHFTGPADFVAEAGRLASDLAASWHVWYSGRWHAVPRPAYGWSLDAPSAAALRDQAETEMASRIPQLRAQLAEAEAADERRRARQGPVSRPGNAHGGTAG